MSFELPDWRKEREIMDKAMLTDLYELTMMAAYVDSRKDDTATFDLRHAPGGEACRHRSTGIGGGRRTIGRREAG